MATTTSKLFKAYLDANEIKNEYVDEEETCIFTGCNYKDISVEMYFCFDDDDESVCLKGVNFVNVSAGSKEKLLPVINDCNQRFRWIKFYYDTEEDRIFAQMDGFIDVGTCAEECSNMMKAMLAIVNTAYPMFMKAIWS